MALANAEHDRTPAADHHVPATREGADEDSDEQVSTGFTSGGPLPAVGAEASPHAAPPSASERAYGSAVVTARRGLRVRSAPNLHAPIIDRLRNGERVQQMNRVGEWVQIAHGAQTAYVHGNYLRSAGGSSELDDRPATAQSSSPAVQQHAPVHHEPIYQAPAHQAAPVHQAPAHQAPVHQAPVQQAPVQQTTPQSATTQAPRVPQSASERAFGETGAPLATQVERVHRGVRIIAPAGAHVGAIDRMTRVIDLEIGQNQYAQDHMQSSHVAVVIIPSGTQMTDLPQFASLRGQHTFDGRDWARVRGSGGTRTADGTWAVGIAEESLVTIPGVRTGYNHEQVAEHEFSHIVHGQGMTPAQRARVLQLFNDMKSRDTNNDTAEFSDHYASSNVNEYFAQSTNVFFGTNEGREVGGRVKSNGRDWLRVNDPGMYAFMVEFYEQSHDSQGRTTGPSAATTQS